jgi:SET domain-containing protein
MEGAFAQFSGMRRYFTIVIFVFAALLILTNMALWSAEAPAKPKLLKINKELDKRTAIKKSQIPGAGNGLFALVKIIKGEVIGELGGLLLETFPEGNHYVGALLECAQEKAKPYKYLDSKEHGANVSRINFAPSKINGVDTHFQNAGIKRLCEPPYFEFVALQDIVPGAEILSSYGPNYDYERFMRIPEVRDYFCGMAKTKCTEKYSYDY